MTKSVEEKLNGTKSMEKSVLKISEHLCPEMLFFNSWVLERYGLRYLSNGIYGLSKLGRVQVPIKLDDQFPLRFTEMCVEVFAFKESIHLMKDLYLDSLDVGDISEQDEDGSTASTYMAPDHAPTPKKKKPGEDHKGARDQNRRELHGDL
ncbi:hypothetical protein BC832DRAFT_401852 [Gaertneriomyces semiglobifer]|nr:hypothetical protein BC832DRAFT_401852 [Gaertneriomyces semiglobifer]